MSEQKTIPEPVVVAGSVIGIQMLQDRKSHRYRIMGVGGVTEYQIDDEPVGFTVFFATEAEARAGADARSMLDLLARIGRDLDLIGSHGEHLKSILALLDKHGRG